MKLSDEPIFSVGFVTHCANVVAIGHTLKSFWPDMRWNLLVRSTLDSTSIAATVRREVQAVEPGQTSLWRANNEPGDREHVREKSLNTTLLCVFAGVSLLLAVIGVYGVMSYTVAQTRTRSESEVR